MSVHIPNDMSVQVSEQDVAAATRHKGLPTQPSRQPTATVSTLRVLAANGDTHIQWDRQRLAAGDPAARAAVEEAERLFAEARARGGQAFRIIPGQPAERLEWFDPQTREILVIPAMRGG
jgi:hypothetical protein